ncbi:amidohydrolase family protein [Acuticoccus kandeliae]|uniref:amidohydrolase family protein n=1 Tax=Acuticoccus kandeliae TaxID=2073160 RepID=UPI000D3E9FCC|nr:amidohydrolase family protein [Acuticoccus kandeliae]
MIIDCHAHVFQHWAGACGHPSSEIHRKYMQKVQTRTSASVFRARDGKEMSGAALFRAGDNSWAGLTDVGFRVGNYGRLDFTIDGEDYHSQYMPVGMQQIVAPPELMLAQMTYAGVDHTILQAGWGYGAMNDYNAFAQNQYPDKFTALLNVDEPRAYTDETLAEFDRAIGLGLKGVYFALDAYARNGFDIHFDDPRYATFWSKVDAKGLPVFFEITAIPDYSRDSYIANLKRLHGLMDRYPNIRWVLVMGPPVGFFASEGKWDFPAEVLAAYHHENLLIEIMFPITWGGKWDYPYPEAQGLIAQMRDLFGAHKLIWGSDMPNVERFCTYRQSLDYVRRYCTFLSAEEKKAVLGANVAAIFANLQPARAAA